MTPALLHPPVASSAASKNAPDSATSAAFAEGGCAACHTIPGVANATGKVGPDLTTIGGDAATRKPGLDAEAYLRESILSPAAFIAPRCPSGDCPNNVMPSNFGEKLTVEQITLIVNYLLTLTGEGVTSAPPYELKPITIVRPAEASLTPFAEPPKTYGDGQVLLGKYLFFDSRLSADATTSCATCHQPDKAWTDGLALSNGYPATLYFRNTPTVMNTVFLNNLYWDGRLDGGDMPTLVRDHVVEAHFMNSDGRLMTERIKQVPEYVQLFLDATEKIPSFGGIMSAVTAYVQSLNSGLTPYDRYLAGETGALSAEAQAGLALFEGKAGCAGCHSGPILSDGRFYNLGVPQNGAIWSEPLRHITFRRFFRLMGTPDYRGLAADPGLYALTLDEADWGAFRTAPLREVAHTAPYMHNGALETLAEIVRFYNEGAAGSPLGLTETEIAQLVAFLESLSSEPVAVEVPAVPDYQIRTLGENK
ncbi:MAG: cytochrome c peroxidase [Chloroflexota bacterium]